MPQLAQMQAELPEPYRSLLAQVTLDLSTHPVVPAGDVPASLAPRIASWKPVPAAHLVKPLDKPGAKGCLLCAASDLQHSRVWHAYGEAKDVAGAVREAMDCGLAGVTPDVVKRHMSRHHYIQPAPLKRLTTQEMLFRAQQLSDREQAILVAVYRHRALSSRQLADLFWKAHTKDDTSAQKSAYRTLRKLSFTHFLYQYRTTEKKSPEVHYFLGRHGAPYVETVEGRLIGNPYVADARKVSEYLLAHDLTAADVFVQLRAATFTNRDQGNLISVSGLPLQLDAPVETWWGARSLQIGYTDPYSGAEVAIAPDGFATLTIDDPRVGSSRLPFWYEWDSGSKDLDTETVPQMLDYIGFAASGAAGQRFPQLAVPGYAPPVLVVTKNANRAYKIVDKLQQAVRNRATETLPYIVVTDMETLRNAPFHPNAWRQVFGDPAADTMTLADHLRVANMPLIEKAALHPRIPMIVDAEAARPKKGNAAPLILAGENLV